MTDQPPFVLHGRTLVPPGKGGWELDSAHSTRPFTLFAQAPFAEGFVRGFKEGMARYGLGLSHLQPGFVEGFMYLQPVPVGAPPGATGTPPKPVLQLVTRIHPELRRRTRTAGNVFADRVWREDLAHWDSVDKPAAIEGHRALQAIEPRELGDVELSAHVLACERHFADSVYLHHKYTIASCFPVGDFIAGAQAWTDASPGELLSLLRGQSVISRGAAADELELAGKAIAASDGARAVLTEGTDATEILESLAARDDVGAEVRGYLDAVRWRCVGYDVGDRAAGEMPNALVEALRATLAGASVRPADDTALDRIRSRVPAEHLEDFDDRLAEVGLIYRLRDERGVYGDGWASGLARRALLEAGRRLVASGRLHDAEHAVDLTASEVGDLLRGGTGPSPEEVAERFAWRTEVTTTDAPEFLPVAPPPPPPVAWLPEPARRGAAAFDAVLVNLFGVPETPNTDTVLHGLAVNSGVYEGIARVVGTSADFDRIKQGDVLVAKATSPFFNVVLPMLGAIVTDRGGQLCHAAIVAREYGIPGIVGTREATARIRDGARVRVDGTTGEVRLLG